MTEIIEIGAIERPSQDQINYFLMKAALWDEVIEQGGVTVEQASLYRRAALARIGMGRLPLPEDIA